MAISKVIIKNFKKFQGIFEIELKKGMNILVGDNGAGKSTILEAIHIALTGEYAGRSIRNQLSTYLFNKKVVDEYLKSVADGKPTEPPSILVELYFEKGTQPEYEGNGNSECKDGLEGIRCSIAFSEEYKKEYEAMVKLKTLKSLPIEFYEIKWTTFARENKIPKYISEKSVLIDSSNYRYQNGSDVYISRIIKDILEPEDITAITQAYRNMVDEFADNNAIAVINNKISEASTIMNGNISLSADHGNKDSWEASLVTQIDGIPFANVGKGAQCIVKTQLALNHRKAENAGVILLEEPESHLSFSRLSMLMDSMNTVTNEKQIIISTHSSFVANKLGLENLIFLANNNCLSMKNLSEDTFKFFKKLAGYDTLRLILCKKAILVEGDSDELIVQRAYMDNHNGKLPIHDGIDVITMRGLTFKINCTPKSGQLKVEQTSF